MKDKKKTQQQLTPIEFDRQHLWHPYTSMADPLPAYLVSGANGVRLQLEDGRELIDGMSSWWCAIHGYNHPALNEAITQQLQKMSHVMFGGITHQPAIDLAKTLIDLTPSTLQKVFLADSGSVAVEVAIKMAVQYWVAKGQGSKSKILSLKGGYHGDTLGAMSVCDPVNGMHQLFNGILPQQLFADKPNTRFGESCPAEELEKLTTAFGKNHHQTAAIILEPIVQGAGGMWFYSADILKHIRKLCDEYDVLFIADEIATGFGRSGKLFACEHANIEPDILCVGKALTGGYMTLAATLTTEKVAEGISAGEHGNVLMHGPTFMGNPLACSVANVSLELLIENGWSQKVSDIETILSDELNKFRGHPSVADVRVLGAIGVIELHEPVNVGDVQKRFVDAGVWIRPFGRLVYLMPPYVISESDLRQLCRAISVAL